MMESETGGTGIPQENKLSVMSPGRVCCHGDGVNGVEGGCGKQNHSTGLIEPIRSTHGAGRGGCGGNTAP